jgi:hypothetical protein
VASKIRNSAKGAPCLLRVPGVCTNDRATVVHCHVRHASAGGIGLKPNDLIGIRGCSACHDWLDQRSGNQMHFELRAEIILGGLIRTLDAIVREGIIEPN